MKSPPFIVAAALVLLTAVSVKCSTPTSQPGGAGTDITFNSLDGPPVKISDHKGSVVLLDYWATWCQPCIVISLPSLQQLYQEQSQKGLKIFAINLEEDKDTVRAFIDKRKYTFPVLLDSNGEGAKIFVPDGNIPQTILIGKDGQIKKTFLGASPDREEEIKQAVIQEMAR